MSMFLNLLSSFLPGARSVRVPIFGGLLWAVFLWLVLADSALSDVTGSAFRDQLNGLIAYLGRGGAIVLGAAAIFVLGAVADFAVSFLSSAVGRTGQRLDRAIKWQRHAYRARAELKRRQREYENTLALRSTLDATGSDKDKAYLDSALKTAEKGSADVQERLGRLRPPGLRGLRRLWLPQNALTVQSVGLLPDANEYAVADRIVTHAYNQAASDYADRTDFRGWPNGWADNGPALVTEFEDPVDALKALDNDLFVEIDRERGERELRVAIAAPLIAISIYGIAEVSWWFVILLVAAIGLFLANSISRSSERARIINLVAMKGLQTPAMKEAAVQGRVEAARAHSDDEAEQEKTAQARRTIDRVGTVGSPTTDGQ